MVLRARLAVTMRRSAQAWIVSPHPKQRCVPSGFLKSQRGQHTERTRTLAGNGDFMHNHSTTGRWDLRESSLPDQTTGPYGLGRWTMREAIRQRPFGASALVCLMGGCIAACGTVAPERVVKADPLAAVTLLPPIPAWADKYADYNTGDMRFFAIEPVMERYDLTRYQAVELQNHYRDLSRAKPDGDPEARFHQALTKVKAGEFESGLQVERLASAPFIVVFDLDQTLYDQKAKSCEDFVVSAGDSGRKARHIKLVPGWAEAFSTIRALGGAIAIFSANVDEKTNANVAAWRWEGKPLSAHPDIAAVMTNSHMVLQSKHEGPGKAKGTRGEPVREPSKDLRVFDPTLTRVIIVDDNPTRLFQHGNTRLFPKFYADDYCNATSPLKPAIAAAMGHVVTEIAEAHAVATRDGLTFAAAYRPYSMMGAIAVQMLMAEGTMTKAETVSYLRAHPTVIAADF